MEKDEFKLDEGTRAYCARIDALIDAAEGLDASGASEEGQCALLATCRKTGTRADGGIRCRTEWFVEGDDALLAALLADFAEEYPETFAKAGWLAADRRGRAAS